MIETATIKPGSESPVSDGVQGAMRCILLVGDDRRERSAVVKRMKLSKVLAEAFSAVLLRSWGLSVPDPYLIPEGESLAYGSGDDGYPSLKQRIRYSATLPLEVKQKLIEAASILSAGFEQTPLALTCDEAIDNRDRNIGNILWDGATTAWIDHELSLGLGQHLKDANKLASMVVTAQKHEEIQQSSIAKWMSLSRENPQHSSDMFQSIPEHHEITIAFATFVAQRLNGLGTRIVSRFPQPKDLLSEA